MRKLLLLLALVLMLPACGAETLSTERVDLSMQITDRQEVPDRLLVDDLRLHVSAIEFTDLQTGEVIHALSARTIDFDFGDTELIQPLGALQHAHLSPLRVTLTVSPPATRGPALLLRGLYLPREMQEPVPLPWLDPEQIPKSLAPNAYPFRYESLATATISWEVSSEDLVSGQLAFPLEVGTWLQAVVLQELDARFDHLGAPQSGDAPEPGNPSAGGGGPAMDAPLHPNFGRVASVERDLLLPLLQTMAPTAGR